MSTLHLGGVKATEALVGVFLLLVLVDPLRPVDLDVLILLLALHESRPKGGIRVLLLEHEKHMEAGFAPLGASSVDLVEEFEFEGVGLLSGFALELEVRGGEFDLFVGDVHQVQLDEDAVLALGPFGRGVSE